MEKFKPNLNSASPRPKSNSFPTTLKIFTDGASRGNPGASAIGILICNGNNETLAEYSEYIGMETCNRSEYKALVKALELAAGHSRRKIICFSDSELMIKQLKGEYRIKNKYLLRLYLKVKDRESLFESVAYAYIPRSDPNIVKVDQLVNKELDECVLFEKLPETKIPFIDERDLCLDKNGRPYYIR